MEKVAVLAIIFLLAGCVKSGDYVVVDGGKRVIQDSNILGDVENQHNVLIVNNVVIHKGDTRDLVEDRLGEPSFSGTTIEGYRFYRYDDKDMEIYFNEDRVISWTHIYFRP